MKFSEKLSAAVTRNDSLLCVGLDVDPALMPINDVVTFNRAIIAATQDLVCCYKPNMAFYEALGEPGWRILAETLDAVPEHIPVILDAKRGDIGNTTAAYARALFDRLRGDAITVNAYGGADSIEPFLERHEKGVIIWCRSSNAGAGDLQDLPVEFEGRTMPLWQTVARKSRSWNTRGNVGIVIGATYPGQLAEARELCPEMPILVPGIGAQDGALAESVRAGVDRNGAGIIVSASRGVLYASGGSDFDSAARAAARNLRDEINRHRFATAAAGA